jgi:hypothetical protein
MRKLWQDIRTHKSAAVLYFVYWLATLTASFVMWKSGLPGWVVGLLFTNSFIAGALVGRWRGASRQHMFRKGDGMRGGMLAGVLSSEATFLLMKGGVISEAIIWMHGFRGEWDQVLVFSIIGGIFGAVLGLAGAGLTTILNRHRSPIPH